MPSADRPASPVEKEEKSSKKQSQSASSKSKDLSHVPCKFFKVGSCTAGSSCPFSHTALDPGAQKDVCAWFVKGNCKFGHKCALAHILPGQSMAMDRKNKKAAQIAAGATKGGGEQKSGRGNRRDGGGSKLLTVGGGGGGGGRSRAPMSMPLKASISPSAPAPPLKDTDFAATLDREDTAPLPTAPARNKSPSSPTLPMSAPRRPSASTSPAKDFGPIGSPPASPSRNPSGTPPTNGMLSTSPFSAPGTQSVFLNYPDRKGMGIAASLGAGPTGWGGSGSPLRASLRGPEDDLALALPRRRREDSNEDLEDFIPSSLTDLLTPEERSRRMSRSTSAQSPGLSVSPRGEGVGVPLGPAPVSGHRYSRSVPAPSLLGGDLKSIWAANDPGANSANNNNLSTSYSSATSGMAGTPSSFVDSSMNEFRGLSPSNASGAFLPGIHHYIAQNKQQQQQHGGAFASNAPPLSNGPPGLAAYLQAGPSGAREAGTTTTTSAANRDSSNANAYIRPNPFDLTQQPRPSSNLSARLGAANANNHNNAAVGLGADALSPASRALQAHAPGQSLPQGLAAGYSRIHALPPLPVVGSVGSASGGGGGVGSPGVGVGSPLSMGFANGIAMASNGNNTSNGPTLQMRDWASMSTGSASFGGSPAPISLLAGAGRPPPGLGLPSPKSAGPLSGFGAGMGPPPGIPAKSGAGAGAGSGLDAMFARMSYSNAATAPATGTGTRGAMPMPMPIPTRPPGIPGIGVGIAVGAPHHHHDDDTLFDLDA
ncbi:hypothetical protein MKEN_00482900 [Mycena kentingensis (nom. inval.)]|nr:hypothetical protein MKEN_00482900 [Mycena kentingensis (nom. inval.)]